MPLESPCNELIFLFLIMVVSKGTVKTAAFPLSLHCDGITSKKLYRVEPVITGSIIL